MNPPVLVDSALTKKLIWAALVGNLAVLREHVSQLPSVRAAWSQSVLHLSAWKGHLECVDFISRALAHPHMMRVQA